MPAGRQALTLLNGAFGERTLQFFTKPFISFVLISNAMLYALCA
jgi:hypothetical protein